MDDFQSTHRRIVRDYRLALGLTLAHVRGQSGVSLARVSDRTGIPEPTLRGYERGSSQPQIQRIAAIAQEFNVSLFDILIETAEYLYRASGRPVRDSTNGSIHRVQLISLLLYGGASPDDIEAIETAMGLLERRNQ